MAKTKTGQEIISLKLNGRSIADIGRICRERAEKLTGKYSPDFAELDLGFELPGKFLQLNGPPPTLAQLTVLANKLRLQIQITHIELVPLEQTKDESGK